MKKIYILGIKLHEYLMKLFKEEHLEDHNYLFGYIDTPYNDVETSFSQLVDEDEEPDLLCLYYLPKKYYNELKAKIDIVDIKDNGFEDEF